MVVRRGVFLQPILHILGVRLREGHFLCRYLGLADGFRSIQTDGWLGIDGELHLRTRATAIVGVRSRHTQHVCTCRERVGLAQIDRTVDGRRTAAALRHTTRLRLDRIGVRIRIFGYICGRYSVAYAHAVNMVKRNLSGVVHCERYRTSGRIERLAAML